MSESDKPFRPGFDVPDEDHDDDTAEGQVSEVSAMDPEQADVPISDSQSVAGNPDPDSGEATTGTAGPNAAPRHDPPEPGNKSSR